MPEIVKTFRCPSCSRRMQLWVRSDDPDPWCPYGCVDGQTAWEPGTFAIGTNEGRAVDIAQTIIEQDFGVTNIADGQCEGDIAYKAEPESREKREQKEQVVEQVRSNLAGMAGQQAEMAMRSLGMKSPAEFWGAGRGFQVAAGDVMASAKGTVDPATNPMRILHKGVQEGSIGEPVKKFRPLARG